MMTRRILAVLGSTLLIMVASTLPADAHQRSLGRFDQPMPGYSDEWTQLRPSSPRAANLDPQPLAEAWQTVQSYTEPIDGNEHPLYASAVLSYGHHGRVVLTDAAGEAVKYADADTELPAAEQIPAETDTIYDMASVSKLFTSIVIMTLVEDGEVDLDAPVADYVPEFGENGKQAITVRQLLTHTSGLPSWLPLWSGAPDPQARIEMALTAELADEPGSTYTYSDLNLIALGVLAERITGDGLDDLVAERITEPLRMTDTGYNPAPAVRDRVAATEFQATPDRGMVWGEVHDENAWSLGGVAGHAGVFSTADDMGLLAQALLNGGVYRGTRILSEQSVTAMITNENTEFDGDDHGLGFELDQRWYMGGLSGPRTAGHTGYTGTSLVLDFASGSYAVLLTNRVHPSRDWGSVNPARVAAAQGLAESLRVRPQQGRDAWFSGTENASVADLTLPVTVPSGGATLSGQTLIDIEPDYDELLVRISTDDGDSWQQLDYELDGEPVTGAYSAAGERNWQRLQAELPGGDVLVRFSYTSDDQLSGRGIYLDDLQVTAEGRVISSPERRPDLLIADGWQRTTR